MKAKKRNLSQKVLYMIAMSGVLLSVFYAGNQPEVHAQAETTPEPGSNITLEGLFSIRWTDEFGPDGIESHKQEYRIQEQENRTIVIELEANALTPAGWPDAVAGRAVKVEGTWASGGADVNGLSNDELILMADSISVLGDDEITALDDVSGSQPYVTILCKFPEEADVTLPPSWFETMMGNQYPGMDHFWREVSNNTIDLSGSMVTGWYDLPKTREEYVGTGGQYWDNCVALADDDVYFPDYVGINIIIDKLFENATQFSGSSDLGHGYGYDGGGFLRCHNDGNRCSDPSLYFWITGA